MAFSFLCINFDTSFLFSQDVFLMIRRKKLTIFTDAKDSTTVLELKKMIEGNFELIIIRFDKWLFRVDLSLVFLFFPQALLKSHLKINNFLTKIMLKWRILEHYRTMAWLLVLPRLNVLLKLVLPLGECKITSCRTETGLLFGEKKNFYFIYFLLFFAGEKMAALNNWKWPLIHLHLIYQMLWKPQKQMEQNCRPEF